ncbi:hypothetical protein [Streptomyces sp. NPDC056987]|uniref:hypothetical protein n=1 Tax=Streptomyces sp. NPDC056987 TaxID=3345988 RepID=UPI0036264F2A
MPDAPPDELRRTITEALTAEHYRRAQEQIVDSPEGHCAAFADVVMPIVQAEMARRRETAAPGFVHGFRLHHNRATLDGAAFPSGRCFVLDDAEHGFATVAASEHDLLLGYHGARIEWPPAGTCDASVAGLIGAKPLGPCVLRHQHDGPVHQDSTGATWNRSSTPDDTVTPPSGQQTDPFLTDTRLEEQ